MKKLNKKKGFTLVEMIVVIAIIGVIAAILIPTMIGYVTKAKVNNINSTAGKMRESISYFLTQANTDGYGMFISHQAVCDVDIIIEDGDWTLTTSDTSVFITRASVRWVGSGSSTASALSPNAEDILARYLCEQFRDIQNGHCEFKLVGGVCFALYVTTDTLDEVDDIPGFGDGQPWAVQNFEWDGSNQGVTEEGYIVGTSPVLQIA